jgi:hypothetical protein
MPKQDNLYNLVEWAAARRGIPRLELWREVALALVDGKLPVVNCSERPFLHSAKTFAAWLVEFRVAITQTSSDPNLFRHILRRIILRVSEFKNWLRNASGGRRGPLPHTTGYQASDRKAFSSITRLIKSGKARSAYGAALLLVEEGKIEIAGGGDANTKAKRLSARYRKEHRSITR